MDIIIIFFTCPNYYSTIDKDPFILKPIGNEELIKEIDRLIENKEDV